MELTKIKKVKISLLKNGVLDPKALGALYGELWFTKEDLMKFLHEHEDVFGGFTDQFFETCFWPMVESNIKTISGARNVRDAAWGKKTLKKPHVDPADFAKDEAAAKEALEEHRKKKGTISADEPRRTTAVKDRGVQSDGVVITGATEEDFKKAGIEVIENHLYPGGKEEYDRKIKEGAREVPPKITYAVHKKVNLYAEKIVRYQLAWEDEHGETHCEIAPLKRFLPHTRCSEDLGANIIVDNVLKHMPFYLQQQEFAYWGIRIFRQTLFRWINRAVDLYLEPVAKLLEEELMKCKTLHADETGYKVLEVLKELNKSMTYMMVINTGEIEPHQIVRYFFIPDRKQTTIAQFFKDFMGFLTTDGAAWFSEIVIDKEHHTVCFAHLGQDVDKAYKLRIKDIEEFDRIMSLEDPDERNKELKAFETNTKHETFVLLNNIKTKIARLYHAEYICKVYATTPDETLAIRQKVSLPVFLELCDLFKELGDGSIKSSQNGKSASYFLDREEMFSTFLENGYIDIDNNSAERNLKIIVKNRDNSLFAQTRQGANRLAVTASVTMTAVQNGLNPVIYIQFLFEFLKNFLIFDENSKQWRLNISKEELAKVLPWSESLPEEVYITKEAFKKAQERARLAYAEQ